MHLGKKIWKRLNKNSTELKGHVSEAKIIEITQMMVKPFGCKIVIKHNKLPKNTYFNIGGEYCPVSHRQPITIFIVLNSLKKGIYFTETRLLDFLFILSQTIQHELIHKMQCIRNKKFYTELYHFTKGSSKIGFATLRYFAIKEEVEAYAHDLAMEIKHFYSDIDSTVILRNPDKYDCLTTWKLYKKAFRKSRWPMVRNQLLKKTYKWLPSIQEKL
jgi:hypothetical protein